jgi:CheY-like chemotaxis protein
VSTAKLLTSPRILMVDDEIEQLKLRAQVIGMYGFAAITANGPIEAIDIMTARQQGTIDLAILDYNMPVMNGCALAQKLRSICPELKTILHSGATDIPQSEMTSVDVLVHKGDGIAPLLDQIVELARVGMPSRSSALERETVFLTNDGGSIRPNS